MGCHRGRWATVGHALLPLAKFASLSPGSGFSNLSQPLNSPLALSDTIPHHCLHLAPCFVSVTLPRRSLLPFSVMWSLLLLWHHSFYPVEYSWCFSPLCWPSLSKIKELNLFRMSFICVFWIFSAQIYKYSNLSSIRNVDQEAEITLLSQDQFCSLRCIYLFLKISCLTLISRTQGLENIHCWITSTPKNMTHGRYLMFLIRKHTIRADLRFHLKNNQKL